MQKQKLFPLKLPSNYHGQVKQFQTPTDKYFKKMSNKETYDDPSKKVSRWQRKIMDSDILKEKRQYLVHPAFVLNIFRRISVDNPDWLKATNHYYHRGEFTPLRRETRVDQKQYDVMGHKKMLNYASKTEGLPRQSKVAEITPKIGGKAASLYKTKNSMPQITQKIGYSEARDRENLVRKPTLKVGSSYSNNFIDTYTVN